MSLKLFNLVPGWFYALALAALSVVVVQKQLQVSALHAEVAQAKADAAKTAESHAVAIAAATAKTLAAERRAREAEETLTQSVATLEKKRNEEVANTVRSYERVLAGLRNRPDRPPAETDPHGSSEPAAATCTRQGATGADLYRSDGAFLIGEATRADILRSALGACYTAWDKAKETLGSMKIPPPTILK